MDASEHLRLADTYIAQAERAQNRSTRERLLFLAFCELERATEEFRRRRHLPEYAGAEQ